MAERRKCEKMAYIGFWHFFLCLIIAKPHFRRNLRWWGYRQKKSRLKKIKFKKVRLTWKFFEKIEIFEIFEKKSKMSCKFFIWKSIGKSYRKSKKSKFWISFSRFFRSQKSKFSKFREKSVFPKKIKLHVMLTFLIFIFFSRDFFWRYPHHL